MDSEPGGDWRQALRVEAVRALLDAGAGETWSEGSTVLFKEMLSDDEARKVVVEFLENLHPISFTTKILSLLQSYVEGVGELSEQASRTYVEMMFNCVHSNLPASNAKVDILVLNFLDVAANFAARFVGDFFVETVEAKMKEHNPNVVAFVFFVMSLIDDISKLLPIVQQQVTPKLTLSVLSFAILRMMVKHKGIENYPTLKVAITAYKSLSDIDLIAYATPLILRVATNQLSSQNAKDISSLMSYVLKRIRKASEGVIEFRDFMTAYLDIPEGSSIVKSYSDDIILVCALNAQHTTDIYLKVVELFKLKPLDYLPRGVLGSLVLANAASKKFSEELFGKSETEALLTGFDGDDLLNKDLLSFSAFAIRTFRSKMGIKILIAAVEKNSQDAYDLLVNDIPFESTFSDLVNSLNPERVSELYVKALQTMLQVDVPALPLEEDSDDKDSNLSDSNFDSIPDLARCMSEMSEEETCFQTVQPTVKTILFCKVITYCNSYPEMMKLLAPSASAISHEFSQELMANMQKTKHKNWKLETVAAYSNALLVLDTDTLYAIVHTFLTMIPGQSMLFLGVSVQSMTREVIISVLQKTVQYAYAYPDYFARMIALVSHSHPHVALAFTNHFVSGSTTKRRVFLVFRSSELTEESLLVVLKIIGYCSVFVDSAYFIADFLQFATNFLNKNLSENWKKPELVKAALFAIRKLAGRICEWQNNHPEFVWPFKDFLVGFVSRYKQTLLIDSLYVLSCLVPVKPVKYSEKFAAGPWIFESNENAADKLKALSDFYTIVINAIPTLSVFVNLVSPLFPMLLTSEHWGKLLDALQVFCHQWNKLKTSQELVDDVGSLTTYIIPLAFSECSAVATEILFELISIQCKIRNDVVSTPCEMPVIGSSQFTDIGAFVSVTNILDTVNRILALMERNYLKFHQKGAAMAIFALLEIVAQYEFKYDEEIVRAIAHIIDSDIDNDVADLLVKAIGAIAKYRLYSVLTALAKHQHGKNFGHLITSLMQGREAEFLTALGEIGVNEEMESFVFQVIPLIGNTISGADDETFAKLFVSTVKQTDDISSPMFVTLFACKPETTIEGYVDRIAGRRRDSFQHILKYLPPNPTKFMVTVSLCCAAVTPHLCKSFLTYATNGELAEDHVVQLTRVFRTIDIEKWGDLADTFADYITDHLMSNNNFIDCLAEFVSKKSNCARLWTKLGELGQQNIARVAQALDKFIGETRIESQFLLPLAVPLILNRTTPVIDSVMKKQWPGTTVESILTDTYKEYSVELIRQFLDRLQAKQRISECATYICLLCKEINENTTDAVTVLIDIFPLLSDNSDIPKALEHLLSK